MSIGKKFVSAVLAEQSVTALLQHGPIEHLFKASEIDVFEFVRSFAKQYHKLPTEETIEAHTGEILVQHTEPAAYYFDLLETRHTELELKKAMKASADLLLPENHDPAKALQTMTESVMQLISKRYAKHVVDFRQAYELLVPEYVAKYHKLDQFGLHFGWPTLDTMSGGLVRGDVISFVGRPAAGKTWQMLYAAHHGWAKAGLNANPEQDQSRMFVSMEMGVIPIQQRLAAMHTHLPALKVKHGALGSDYFKKLRDGLTEVKGYGAPFYVVDGNLAATVEDIYILARQLNPAGIFIDGAYLVKHPFEKDRYRRVAENAELIKKELASIAPTVCSWQFAKTAAKKNVKKGEKVGLEDIGYTDAIAQVSSLVLGLFEEESVETLTQRKVEILKGRSGEVGSFVTNWNFRQMLFNEITVQNVEDLQFGL